MKDLYIIGAGSVGGHVAMNFKEYGLPYRLIGFFDDDPSKIGTDFCGYPVIDQVAALLKYEQAAVVIGIAFPKVKHKIWTLLKQREDFEFPTLVSPHAWVSEGVQLGWGTIVYPNTSINYGTEIEDFVILNMNCAIGHDCWIGAFSSLAPGVNLGGCTRLGRSVEMGIGSATKQGVEVGDEAVVGGQCMLIRPALSRSLIVGVPGKPSNKN